MMHYIHNDIYASSWVDNSLIDCCY